MSTVTISDTPFVGNDRLLVGIVLSVLTFWLFAQSVINVVPAMKSSLDISLETLTLAVSLSALFSGCFVVASGGLADKFGRMRMTTLGLQQDNNHQNEEAADVAGDQGEFFRGHLVAERLIIVCKQDVAPE